MSVQLQINSVKSVTMIAIGPWHVHFFINVFVIEIGKVVICGIFDCLSKSIQQKHIFLFDEAVG